MNALDETAPGRVVAAGVVVVDVDGGVTGGGCAGRPHDGTAMTASRATAAAPNRAAHDLGTVTR